jgi:hypothetical protein
MVLLVRAHAKVTPDGQGALHVGVALKTCLPPAAREAVIGVTATESKVVTGRFMVITTGELCTVTPLSVALTKSPTLPELVPAVNVTEEPWVIFSVPRVLRESAHEYATLEGQDALQVGVAVNP